MIVRIDLQSDIPLYQQLVTSIIKAIANNELVSGESLPPVRQLSADLGINMHTVSKAYNILKQKGFLSVNRSKGAIINSSEYFTADQQNTSIIKSNLTRYCRVFSSKYEQ